MDSRDLARLAAEIRRLIVATVNRNGGHLGSNLGIVELTISLHRVFESPRDAIVFDTGHQAYPHKLLTGRRRTFDSLRRPGGMSGYPSRVESAHDWIENSHASTALSYAHGLATAFKTRGEDRRVVAVVGDGSLTGGMAMEGLNNLGHSNSDVTIILNDNGRSYAPTVSKLSESLIKLRASPVYMRRQERIEEIAESVPWVGDMLRRGIDATKMAIRQMWDPPAIFEATRYPLRRTLQRPRDRRARRGTPEGQVVRRADRGACHHPEGSRLQAGRERPDKEYARPLVDQEGQLHGRLRRASRRTGPSAPRARRGHRRYARLDRDAAVHRPVPRGGRSMSVSPSSTL